MYNTQIKKRIPLIVLLLALVFTAAACGAVEAQPQDTPAPLEEPEKQEDSHLVADLSVPETVPLCEPVELEFRVTNQSDQTLYLLTWYTPLEGVLGDIFRVTRDGQELSYLGPMVMRAAPLAEQYILLGAGESATAVVDVSKAYDFSKSGRYSITFQSPRISHLVDDPSEFAASVDELGPVQISSQPVEVEIVPPENGGGDCAPSAGAPPTDPGQGKEPDRTLTGIVKEVSPSAQVIWLQAEVNGFTTIALTADSTITKACGEPLELDQIQPGLTVRAFGQPGENQALLAHDVQVVPPIEPNGSEIIIDFSMSEFHTKLPSGVSIDMYELEDHPSTEPLVFTPVSDKSQNQILAVHENYREEWFDDPSFFNGMAYGMQVPYAEGELIAQIRESTIEVIFNHEVIYTVDTGDMSSLTPLRSLWSYDQNWVLEYADIAVTYDETENTVYSEAVGHIVRNGVLLNEENGYDEAFGFQLLNGKPFYFYQRNGQIGVSWIGEEMLLGFDKIFHYGCCSAGILNPNRAQRMVSFFAHRNEAWYYVEIGMYE